MDSPGLFICCDICGLRPPQPRFPRAWKIRRRLVFCPECRNRLYRLRSLTFAVAPMSGRAPDFRSVWEHCRNQEGPLLLPEDAWQFTIEEGQPLVRVLVEARWCWLSVPMFEASRGRKDAYERIVSGEALTGELSLCAVSTEDPPSPIPPSADRAPRVLCRTVAWLPRGGCVNRRSARFSAACPDTRLNIEEVGIRGLQKAIRANRVSFPLRVPAFPGCGPLQVQHKIVDLYFLVGWNSTSIAAQYGLTRRQVCDILGRWKRHAVNAGFVHYTPTIEAVGAVP